MKINETKLREELAKVTPRIATSRGGLLVVPVDATDEEVAAALRVRREHDPRPSVEERCAKIPASTLVRAILGDGAALGELREATT